MMNVVFLCGFFEKMVCVRIIFEIVEVLII